jgi:hypothetical protein
MTDLEKVLVEFVQLFERLGVSYAVMGGIAVRVHGIPRATYDLDFTLAIPRSQLTELYQWVQHLGYTVPEPYLAGWLDEVRGMPLIKVRLFLRGQGIDVDIFLAESPYQESVLARRELHHVNGHSVWFVTAEDLILLKLLAARPRDLADIGDVLFTQGQLDLAYLRHWAEELGLQAELERALADR